MTPSPASRRNRRRIASLLALSVMLAACDATASTPAPSVGAVGGAPLPAPTASAAGQVTELPPLDDVVTYKADASRSSRMPGPDITVQPLLAWKTSLGCAIGERAVVIGRGTAVIGCNDARLYGLDARTGAIRWKTDISAPIQGSAAIADGRVFLGTAGGSIEAHSLADGSLLWAVDTEGAGNPVVIDGVVYIGTADGFTGLDASDGSIVWRHETAGVSGGTVVDGVAYLNAPGGIVRAVDVHSKAVIWEHRVRSSAATSPVITADTVFVGARQEAADPEGELYALDRATGKVRWSWRTDSGLQVVPSAAVDDALLARTEDLGLFALDPATGAIRWNMAGANGFVPATTTGGVAYTNLTDPQTLATYLLGVDVATGAELWREEVDGEVAAAPVASGGMIFIGDGAGNVYGFAEPDVAGLLAGAPTPAPTDAPAVAPSAAPVGALLAAAATELDAAGLGLSMPMGMDVGPDGNVYLVNAGTDEVLVLRPDGTLVRRWGSSGSGAGQLEFQRDAADPGSAWGGLGVAPDGTVYVAESKNYRVQAFTPEGTARRSWGRFGSEDGQFQDPLDADVAPDGVVYVLDDARNDIQAFTPDGEYVRTVGRKGTKLGELQYPGPIHVDTAGNLYNADWGNGRIQAWDATGTPLWSFGSPGTEPGQFKDPRDVAVGSDGTVYAADQSRVQAIRDGELVGTWTSPGPDLGSIQIVGDELWVSAPWDNIIWRLRMEP